MHLQKFNRIIESYGSDPLYCVSSPAYFNEFNLYQSKQEVEYNRDEKYNFWLNVD